MSTPKLLQASPLAASKVDAEAGIIKDVAIMSIGEAAGHGVRIDAKTLSGLFALTNGRAMQSFILHADNHSPTEVAGLFSGGHIDPKTGTFRATWQAMSAFKEHEKREFSTLMELAEKAPETFGVSADIDHEPVWTMKDGSEVPAKPKHKVVQGGKKFDGWEPKPEGATDDETPAVRVVSIRSADFVQEPATNKSLFSKTALDVSTVSIQDVSTKQTQEAAKPAETQPKPSRTVKAIFAKYSANPQHLQRAVKFMAENEGATEEKAIEETDKAISAEEVEALKASVARLTTERDELAAKLAETNGEKETLKASADELPAAKEALSKASAELTEVKGQLSAANLRLSRYGAAPLKLSVKADETAPVEVTGLARTAAAFAKSAK